MNHVLVNISTLLIVAASAVQLSFLFKPLYRLLAVTCLILLSVILPVAGSNPWKWINGAIGELSIMTMILLAGFIIRKLTGFSLTGFNTRLHIYLLIFIAGLLLFPATLGLTQFDPYSLGYRFELSLFLLVLSILYWILQQRQLAIILLIIVAANETGILSSNNTWDYLIDPLLWIASPVMLVAMYIGGEGLTGQEAE
jgi:hypothetical protein